MPKLTPGTDSLILECECSRKDHLVEFTLEDWPGPSLNSAQSLKLIVRPILNSSTSFFSRLVIAFKYLFKRNTEPQFMSVMISDEEDILSLERLLKRFIGIRKLREATKNSYVRGID